MSNLFSWLLRRFITAFIILVAVQLAAYILGLNIILTGYEKNQLEQYRRLAEKILIHPEQFDPAEAPAQGPFFVFSADKQLIFSNRGKGRSISVSEYRPLYVDGVVAGYFHVGDLGFAENQSNRVFLISIIILSAASIFLSLIIGFFAAWFSSAKISEPVNELRKDIHSIRSMKSIPHRRFRIKEFAEMSGDIEGVSSSLSSQEEYKQKWLSDLAHDLRTPLAGLKSQLEGMADGVLEPTEERFRRQLGEIARLESLAASTAELTAIESRDRIEKKYIKAEDFIKNLITPFEMEIKNSGIVIETEVQADELLCDENLLLRAAGNIIANSLKYIGDGNKIWIRIGSSASFDDPEKEITSIEIANNGPDIAHEQRELIFSRLYRGDSGRATPGSGLGLAITKEIVLLHGGEIRAEQLEQNGEYTRGIRFIIILP